MQPPTLYLFVGVPGAGKTTVAEMIHEATGAVHLWADQERQALFDSPTHTHEESRELYEQLNARTDELLGEGQSVVFDTNFNYRHDRDHLRAIAAKHQAKTQIIWLQTPLEVARERAMHETHRDRNGYDHVMTEAVFTRLIDHLEPPTENEHFIKIDGSDLDLDVLKRHLNL